MLVSATLASLTAGGCGPIEYLNQVSSKAAGALAAAKQAQADRYAPYEYTAAEEYLHKAREEAAYAEYQDSIEYGRKAEDLAHRARAIALDRVRQPSAGAGGAARSSQGAAATRPAGADDARPSDSGAPASSTPAPASQSATPDAPPAARPARKTKAKAKAAPAPPPSTPAGMDPAGKDEEPRNPDAAPSSPARSKSE